MGIGKSASLKLRAGEWIVVRDREEILTTLDEGGRLDGLLFQPEMFAFCGKRMRVVAAAHKTCDTISKTGGRKMDRTVHLEQSRCNGSAHGGCQADCLLFWKEAWLRRADQAAAAPIHTRDQAGDARVFSAVRLGPADDTDVRWQCQATTLLDATQPLSWWDPRQYWMDVRSRNHTAGYIAKLLFAGAYRRLIHSGYAYRALISVYNKVQQLRGGRPYTTVVGKIPRDQPTPVTPLDLQVGDWVKVKMLTDVEKTLHEGTQHNRGMLFDVEMTPFCGTRQRVKARIDRIIDERSGRMIPMKTACIELEDVYCKAICSDKRLGCPRAIPSYWREAWLERV